LSSDVDLGSPGQTTVAAALETLAARSAAQMSAENFPVALKIVPARPRADLARIYAFARFVDDVGDESDGDRLLLLDAVDADLHTLWTGGAARLSAVAGLAPLIEQHAMPIEPFTDLVQANRVDQTVGSYADFDALLGYCRLSAAPIGRMVLHVAHAASDRNVMDSDAVCAALQVLEHCQDVGEDARAGRVYLPADDLAAAGVERADLLAGSASPALRRVVARQVDRSLELLGAGRPLVRRLSGWSRVAVSGYVAGGLATAAALRAADHDVLTSLVKPGKTRTLLSALTTMMGR